MAALAADHVLLGRTPAGAEIFGPRSAYPPTVLTLRSAAGLTSYSLMGGP